MVLIEKYVNRWVKTDEKGIDVWQVQWCCPVEVSQEVTAAASALGLSKLDRGLLVQSAADAVDFVSCFESRTSGCIQFTMKAFDTEGEPVFFPALVELRAGPEASALVSIPTAPVGIRNMKCHR